MTKPSQPSSPKSKDEKVTKDTATDDTDDTSDTGDTGEAMEQSAIPKKDNGSNSKAEDKQGNKKEGEENTIKHAESHGVPIADLMGEEGSLHFSSLPEESAEHWKKQAQQWEDQAKRAIAEATNTRNRLERERAELLKFAAAPLANEIFQVADILNNAIKSLPDAWQDNKELKNFIDGLHMTEQSLQAALQKHHIRKIGKIGDKFDATYHQAVSVIDDKTAEPNSIIEVLQPGYMLHDRILRPAQVIISKPSPQSSPKSST